MASTAITASMQRACSTHHSTKKRQPHTRPAVSCVTKQATHRVTLKTGGQQGLTTAKKQEKPAFHIHKSGDADDRAEDSMGPQTCVKFFDERWKNGTWDLNMFVIDGTMDWDGVIVAEAKRRKFLELYPEAATNQDPVLFRSSIIPWGAWIMHSHLPETELLNGQSSTTPHVSSNFLQ